MILQVDTVESLSSTAPLFPIIDHVDWSAFHTLLDIPSILLLNYSLPHELRQPWRLLFSSQRDGESFSTLLKHVLKKGPNIIIVKDSDGYVFGALSTETWTIRPQFVGELFPS